MNFNLFCYIFKNQGVKFQEEEVNSHRRSWSTSGQRCLELIQRIIGTPGQPGLTPHRVRDTLSVNEARRLIIMLSEPLNEITANIEDNLTLIEKHKIDVEGIANDLLLLRKKMYIPVCDMQIIELANPQTVCTSVKCRNVVHINGIIKHVFDKKCHDKCTVYGTQREGIGDERIRKCSVFKWYTGFKKCKKCGCSYKEHKHIYTETKINIRDEIDHNVKKQLDQISDAQTLKQKMIERLEIKSKELNEEEVFIMGCQAKFAIFVKENAIAPFSDVFKVV